jgi:hypothetical protein
MSKVFLFSDGLNKFGPFSKEEIEQMMFENKLYLTDLIFDTRNKQWTKILLHPDFVNDVEETPEISEGIAGLMPDSATPDGEKLKKEGIKDLAISKMIKAAQKEEIAKQTKVFTILQDGVTAESDSSGKKDSLEFEDLDAEKWYIKEGGVILGPYHFLTILTMMRDHSLDDRNYLRKGKNGPWQIATMAFSLSEVANFEAMTPGKTQSLLPPRAWLRKNLRRDFDMLFYVNDGKQEYIVQGFDISEQGISFVTMVPCFALQQRLLVSLVVTIDNIIKVDGEVLRIEKVESKAVDMILTKYALKLDQKIDLSRVFKGEDQTGV